MMISVIWISSLVLVGGSNRGRGREMEGEEGGKKTGAHAAARL